MITDIIIIGGGWYGCYVAYILSNKYNIILIDKNDDIFEGSSYYNQNRLHLGFHYPRNNSTRLLCKNNFTKFIDQFEELVDTIENNYYAVSNESLIDYETYKSIYDYNKYDYKIVNNTKFTNIDGKLIIVSEKIINSQKSKSFFKKNLKDKVKFIFNIKIINIITDNSSIILNDYYKCDFLFDCTFNSLNINNSKHLFEKSISFFTFK